MMAVRMICQLVESVENRRQASDSFEVVHVIVIGFYTPSDSPLGIDTNLYKTHRIGACGAGEPQRDTPAFEAVLCVHDGIQALWLPIALVHLHACSGHGSQRAQHTL